MCPQTCAAYSHKLFAFGQQVAAERGLILVDTKYEFGKDEQVRHIMLVVPGSCNVNPLIT
jgi:phosphoribosylaminoimidazole-succinocarboxamide synthase